MISQILSLLSLLHHNQSVTRKQIMTTCGISERSAYRYVTRLSEANIPIYFDSASRGYRLTRALSLSAEYLSVSDILLIRTALKLLRSRLGDSYAASIHNIETLLDRMFPGASQAGLEPPTGLVEPSDGRQDLSEIVSYCCILQAMNLGKKVRLKIRDDGGEPKTATIARPTLRYDNEWLIRDLNGASITEIPLSSVADLQLI